MPNATARRTVPFVALLGAAALGCASLAGGPPAAAGGPPAAAMEIAPVARHADAKLGLEVVEGTLTLPARFTAPRLAPAAGERGVDQVFLRPPAELHVDARARRAREADREEAIASPGPAAANDPGLRAALRCYGKAHGGVGPASLSEPDFVRCVARGPDADAEDPLPPPPPYEDGSDEAQWVETLQGRLARFAILPKVPLRRELLRGEDEPEEEPAPPPARKGKKSKAKPAPADPPVQPLLVELAPAADDGRHWVVDNALAVPEERVQVDAALLARHKLALRKDQVIPALGALPRPDDPIAWRVLALRRGGATRVALELWPEAGAAARPVTWAIGGGSEGTRDLLVAWGSQRILAFDPLGEGDGPLQRPLVEASARAYGIEDAPWSPDDERTSRRRSDPENPTLLSLLGGRAAVDETLQLDRSLAEAADATESTPEQVAIAEVEGITVESHPWAELLAGKRAPQLPLADCVPPDRFFLYLPNPKEAVDGLENGGAGFLARVSSFAKAGKLDYAVVTRYLDDLGLGGGLGRKLLRLGAIREAVIFTTDLSLLAGTEVTVVAEVAAPFQPLLPLDEGKVKEKDTPGGKAYSTRRGGRVFLSTSRAELDRALALDAAHGAGSLGRSDELAYLLLQLAPTARSQAFAYLSDPFIRRLVGPAQRIAQLRQSMARAQMERLAGAALLRRLDAPGEKLTVEGLKKLGYLDPAFPEGAYALAPDGRVSSPVYGPLDHLFPVARLPIDSVTAGEAEQYGRFRERYTEYWKKFFDPIAVRLDQEPDGSYALETFILPLLDDSIYRTLSAALAPAAPQQTLAPRWSVPMVTELSFALPTDKFKEQEVELRRALARALGFVPEELVQTLQPTLHIAFPDAAPILHVGGGSAAGVLAADLESAGKASIPLVIAAFTRPMVIAIEVADPAAAQRALDQIGFTVIRAGHRDEWVSYSLAREADGRLILSTEILGMVTTRLTVRVEDRWLVLCNDTNQPARLVAGQERRPGAVASVALRPGALKAGIPSAWQSAVEAEAGAAFAAQHWLAPWLVAGESVAQAKASSRSLLGSAPLLDDDALLPRGNHRFDHRRYGSRARVLLPPRDLGHDFGLFEGVSEARVDMSFEGAGLRARVRWTPLAR